MLSRLFSNDLPRNRLLTLILLAILIGLALAPFLFPGVKALNVAAKILIFIVLVAGFDLLLGYTGIVSFAHTMFFGIGAYGIAIATTRIGPTWGAIAVGVAGALLLSLLLSLAVGLLIRAGVQDREMVESLGYRIRRLFIGVFVVGSALAGLGGVMWGLYQQNVIPQMGAQVNILIFIVIIIGGLGSTTGALIGALLVGLMANYTGFLAPKVALFSNIALMVAILLWRPQGVYPVANR